MIVALLVFVTACGSSSARPTTPAPAAHPTTAAPPCGPAAATTVAASHRARAYQAGNAVYGCAASAGAAGRSFRLGNATRTIDQMRAGPVAVAGVLAAYGLTSFGVDTIRAQVVVRRLTDGRQLQTFAATNATGAESFESVGSVVVKADGAVAWIARVNSIGGRGQATEVHSARAGAADVVLGSGPGIDPSSLRLRGSTLSWRDAGTTRRATLH